MMTNCDLEIGVELLLGTDILTLKASIWHRLDRGEYAMFLGQHVRIALCSGTKEALPIASHLLLCESDEEIGLIYSATKN